MIVIPTREGKDRPSLSLIPVAYVYVLVYVYIIMKSLDPVRANKIFIRKKLGHTVVWAIKASSVTEFANK